jgi:hypothetical protein
MKLTATGFSEVTPPDYAEAKRALSVLIAPGQTFELRALPFGRSAVCRNATEALAAIEQFRHAAGVYYTLNPCRADLDGTAKDRDILSRRWMLVDLDPVRPKDTSATDEEKDAAKGLALVIVTAMSGEGWPSPVIIDSGNGYHLLYRVDLPADKLARQWVKGVLKSLAERFDTDGVKIDRAVHNESRISKLPGTWARKGTETPDRPHRMARLVYVPEVLTCITTDQLQALVSKPEPEPASNGDRLKLRATSSGGVDAYCRAALQYEAAAVALAHDGERNNALNIAAFKLGTLLHYHSISRSDVESALTHAAKRAGLSDREIAITIKSGLDAGLLEPREIPEGGERASQSKAGEPKNDQPAQHVGQKGRKYAFPLIVRGSDVVPKPIRWFWRDRIPFGFLTLMAGRTGVGKSFVTLDIGARFTVGGEIPMSGGECFEPGRMLMISEDSHEYVLAPRLIEAGADSSRYSFMSWEAMNSFKLDDEEMLTDAYHEAGMPKLVIIDPPTNFLGQKDEHRNAEVRGVLMGVSIWAMRYDVAVVMITHCNKGVKKDMAALDRIIGSVAWASTSRIAHLFAKHPEQRGQSVFIPLKSNIGRLPSGLTYQISDGDSTARVEWLATVEFDADDALYGEKKSRGVVAAEWIVERFREKREWPSDELKQAAKEVGLDRKALWSPEVNAMPIRKRRRVDAAGEIHWYWQAEDGFPPEKK